MSTKIYNAWKVKASELNAFLLKARTQMRAATILHVRKFMGLLAESEVQRGIAAYDKFYTDSGAKSPEMAKRGSANLSPKMLERLKDEVRFASHAHRQGRCGWSLP